MPRTPDQQTDLETDPSTDLLTDLQAETTPLTLQIILDQVTEIATPTTTTHTTDRDTTETPIEIGDTNTTQDMNREAKTSKTGMITIKIETGLTTEEDPTNTSITGTNPKHKSFSNSQTST